mmetsp:Transcript_69947/g.193439  ORF Transcript_69947/g.193439 Transcript_69947/m.193439 type:complete len:298 (-) Transcript_69947:441-1334(-)
MPGISSESALRNATADLLVMPICIRGLSTSTSSSSSASTVTLTISRSLLSTFSKLRAFMSSFSPVSVRGALFFTTGSSAGACWICCSCGCCCPMAACCACHCSSCHWSQSACVHCGSCTNSSWGPVMCSIMPRATHSPRVSLCSRKIVNALFSTESALLVLPATRCTSASMHMTEAMLTWSSASRKMESASSTAAKAFSASMAAVWICATTQSTDAMSLLLPVFLASAAASSANSRASMQSCSKSGSTFASGSSAWPCTSISRRICATRKAAATSPSESAASNRIRRALSAARKPAS